MKATCGPLWPFTRPLRVAQDKRWRRQSRKKLEFGIRLEFEPAVGRGCGLLSLSSESQRNYVEERHHAMSRVDLRPFGEAANGFLDLPSATEAIPSAKWSLKVRGVERPKPERTIAAGGREADDTDGPAA
jgi:hypothetical protein